MAKVTKWHKGVEAMVAKNKAKTRIASVYEAGALRTTKKDFILLSKRAKLGGWKKAVSTVVNKGAQKDALDSLSVGMVFHVTPAELRRVADLF